MPLWQVDIYPAEGQIDREAIRVSEEIAEVENLKIGNTLAVVIAFDKSSSVLALVENLSFDFDLFDSTTF